MRALVMSENKFFVPLEAFPQLLDAFQAWRERHRAQMEVFEFFVGGGGGFGIVNVPDESALNRMMNEYPFGMYSEVTIRPILDGDTALSQLRETVAAMTGGS